MDEELRAWDSELIQIHHRIARHFYRSEPRQRVLSYLRALLSPLNARTGGSSRNISEKPDPMAFNV